MKNYKIELGKMFASNKLTKEEFEIIIGIYYEREKETHPPTKAYFTRQLNKTLENKEKVSFKHLKWLLDNRKENQ